MIIDNYENLSNCYSDKGDYKQALHYKNLYITFKDSLFNDNNSRIITEMQTKYETEKKEKEIKILNQNKILSSLKAHQQIEKLTTQRYFNLYAHLSTQKSNSFIFIILFVKNVFSKTKIK